MSKNSLGFNLKEQLAFYGSYHSNPINQAIHAIFVPLILWSTTVWLATTPPLLPVPRASEAHPSDIDFITYHCVFNGTFALLGSYAFYYILLAPVAGISWTLCVALPMWITANFFYTTVSNPIAWSVGVHIFSWFAQVHLGHIVYEKRKPALLDSLLQSLILAPLFVWFEVLFFAGFYPALYTDVQGRVQTELSALQSKKR